MYYSQPVVHTTTTFAFAPPQRFTTFWYYSLYTQIQQAQLYEMQAWFMSVDLNRNGQISAQELQYLMIGGTHLGIETASKLVKVFDCNRSGQIDFYEYAALHQFINNLYRSFCANDRNFSGTIDAHEIHNALMTSGFNLPFHTVNYLFLKISPSGYGLLFTQFLSLCGTVALTRSLFEWNDPMRTGMVHLNLTQLYDIVSIV
ncbi:hypothetical protein DICPUDRAFT_55539 [Dictyostelium purpureum]|uniref:EF-hand domain-containing protein n=1 Tax=Dictyostelium purpureum TaxID=5786 RepID=F0ZMI8_DICPU|nr:uncharacterized protein DICPUDRAFT_55539 [Dictyostelium purpureum]EGC34833.1 hypothetical protein DICPUDRAFT_55539 [Dictyostelium purpureum]|eukprot:XP_003288640.1 hypothetical protein DICPUDRAFT_55539 [Dictyostelium purpureum]